MDTVIDTLAKTPLPTILVIAGIVFLFLAVGGQLGARFSTRKLNPLYAMSLGLILLVAGIWMQIAQARSNSAPARDKLASVTPAPADQQARADACALKGPPVKGQAIKTEARMEMRDARVTIEDAGKFKTGKTSVMSKTTSRVDVVAVEDNRATVLRMSLLDDAIETIVEMEGQAQKETKRGPLEGRSILIELRKGRWMKTLEGQPPDTAQEVALQKPYVDPDESYPAGKVPPGHTWELKDHQMAQYFPDALSISGRAYCTFERVEMHRGQKCAAISARLEMKAKLVENNVPMDVELSANSRTYRSLNDFVDLDSDIQGKILFKQVLTDQDKKAGFEIVGSCHMIGRAENITDQLGMKRRNSDAWRVAHSLQIFRPGFLASRAAASQDRSRKGMR